MGTIKRYRPRVPLYKNLPQRRYFESRQQSLRLLYYVGRMMNMTNDNEEYRTVRLQVTVTPTEAAYIRQMAKDNGVTVSDLIREVMVGLVD